MLILTLNDGTQFEVDDVSTIDQISITTEVDNIATFIEKITTANLHHATLGNDIITNVILNNINVTPINPVTEMVTIIFYLGMKSEMDIIQERLDEQDAALMELAELIAG